VAIALQSIILVLWLFWFFHSHFPVTYSRTDQFSGTYFKKLYLRSPSGYVLLWLKTGGGLNSETSCFFTKCRQ